jgi:hypothetical protein
MIPLLPLLLPPDVCTCACFSSVTLIPQPLHSFAILKRNSQNIRTKVTAGFIVSPGPNTTEVLMHEYD